jgi:hypothetical protein
MARIPSAEGFGQVVAEPKRVDRRRDAIMPDAAGAGLARAVGGIATDMVRVQRAEDERVRIEGERTRDAAEHATTVRAVHAGRESMAGAHDDFVEKVKTGEIPKDKAADLWNTRVNEIRTESLKGVPAKYSADAQMDFDSQTARFGRGIGKAVTERDQADVRQGLNSTFEAAQRLYMKDPAGADKMVDDAIMQFGPHSGMPPDALEKAKQGWKENTRFTKASEMIVAARRDNKSLAAVEKAVGSDEFSALDPQRKVQLMTQIEGFKVSNIQRAEAEARAAQAARERQLREAETAFNAANGLVQTGKVLSPEYITTLTTTMKGTPFAAALPDLIKQAPEKSAFGMQPLSVMDASINRLRADLNVRGTDPATEKRVTQLETIRDQARKDYEADPLIAAQERGILTQIAQVDTRSVAGLVGSLGERVNQASLVAQQTGQPTSPLTKQEAEAVGQAIRILPVEQRSSAVAQLAQAMGPQQAAALGRQMAPKDNALGIALGMAGDKTTAGRYTSELVLKGSQAIKDRAIKEDNAALTGIRARVVKEIGDAYPDQSVREAMIEGAVYAEYGLQSEGSGDPARAVRLVTGGLTERNGRKVPLPRGMTAPDFDKRLQTLTVDSLRTALPGDKVYVSGAAMSATDFLKQVPNASLIHAGQGRYAVQTGAGLATNSDGSPLVFEVK